MRWPGIVVALAATACFNPAAPEGAACNAAGECPDGLSCTGGVCVAPGSSRPDAPRPDVAFDGSPGCASHPPLGAFADPTLVMELSTAQSDGTPSFTADRLELFFKSSRTGGKGGQDIWRATRTSVGAAWSAPVSVDELDTASDDLATEISPDGLTLYFASDRNGTIGDLDLWVATRPDRMTAFGSAVRIAELSSTSLDEGIFVSADQRVAYFHSTRVSMNGQATLFRASRPTATSAWSPPVEVSELSSNAGDENPWVTADDCVIYFQSSRNGTTGAADLWTAKRPAPGEPFGTATNLSAINSTSNDSDPLLTGDERYIMFVSNRPGVGLFDIYEASR